MDYIVKIISKVNEEIVKLEFTAPLGSTKYHNTIRHIQDAFKPYLISGAYFIDIKTSTNTHMWKTTKMKNSIEKGLNYKTSIVPYYKGD
jgi:hypothetical protein